MRRIELLLRPRGRQMRGRESSNLAKLYFRYGAMGSSKTANALMVQYNYLERGQNALIFKPRLDTRDGEKAVVSRSGLRAACAAWATDRSEAGSSAQCRRAACG